ncbi:ABC transporter [Mesorhizobium sp. KR1-2]|uniref:ABC transporter n=1 Tax=Mesorhizobium sp. KR1-2 TaxID=3156609 RepID=UPI0032B53C45
MRSHFTNPEHCLALVVALCASPKKQRELGKLTTWRIVRPHLSRLVRFFHISSIEARSERQSSYLGILWGPLSTLIFTAMLALVFRQPHLITVGEFYLYVLAGYVLWSFITATVTSSTTVIQRRFDFAVHNNLTLVGLFYKLLIDRLFAMSLDLVLLVFAIILLAPGSLGLHLALLPPLLVVLALVSLAVAYLVNLAVILFPDLDAIFNVGVRFMFFVSPVFWGAEGDATGVRGALIDYNPAAYFLSVFRQSFGVVPLEPKAWIVAIGFSVSLCVIGIIAYDRSHAFVRNLK